MDATCSIAITASISAPPWPPSACGSVMPIKPCAAISFATSNGKCGSWARLSASFSRCACANRRTLSANSCCSSVNENCIGVPSLSALLQRSPEPVAAVRRVEIAFRCRRLGRHHLQQDEAGAVALADEARSRREISLLQHGHGALDAGADCDLLKVDAEAGMAF